MATHYVSRFPSCICYPAAVVQLALGKVLQMELGSYRPRRQGDVLNDLSWVRCEWKRVVSTTNRLLLLYLVEVECQWLVGMWCMDQKEMNSEACVAFVAVLAAHDWNRSPLACFLGAITAASAAHAWFYQPKGRAGDGGKANPGLENMRGIYLSMLMADRPTFRHHLFTESTATTSLRCYHERGWFRKINCFGSDKIYQLVRSIKKQFAAINGMHFLLT